MNNINKFTEDDLDACWPDYYKVYLVELLNGVDSFGNPYTVENAREDLRSLIGSKWDQRVNN